MIDTFILRKELEPRGTALESSKILQERFGQMLSIGQTNLLYWQINKRILKQFLHNEFGATMVIYEK